MSHKILFISGTRADFGKLKSLLLALSNESEFEIHLFVTGMHMLSKYGYTHVEIDNCNFDNVYKYVNQNYSDNMDHILAKTITGLSDYVTEIKPDLIVVHGDRVETLAGSIVGSFNNILVAHIEGGEVSGTIDELIRHSVSKLSHLHFVSNSKAKSRLMQMGEREEDVFIIGSPDIDIMLGDSLPNLTTVRSHYEIKFDKYAVAILHPVTTEIDQLQKQVSVFVNALKDSKVNYIIIFPNNDHGSDVIMAEYKKLITNPGFKVFPSMRFEYFLTVLRNAEFIIGNSSVGIREAPIYGVPTINIGTRQKNRSNLDTILNCNFDLQKIKMSIDNIDKKRHDKKIEFGDGNSDIKFMSILKKKEIFSQSTQKHFVDL